MTHIPKKQGLYRKKYEHDNCGIGFVAHTKGQKSHAIIQQGLEVLANLKHRGSEGADNQTGDGAGITIQIPHALYAGQGFSLPEAGHYGTGLFFLPQDNEEADFCLQATRKLASEEGLELVHTRRPGVNREAIGEIARQSMPDITQVFITGQDMKPEELERKLYILRRRLERHVENSSLAGKDMFYVVSLSTRTITYKGLLTSTQLRYFYEDLRDERAESAIAMVHSRYSTNTLPTWDLAQPFRSICHNGEINSVQGNKAWMQAREPLLQSDLFGDKLHELKPIVQSEKSDSAVLDNTVEFLVQSGKTLPQALSVLIPESWNARNPIPDNVKAFYEYHSTFIEPWDGPAAVLFTDGRYIGGLLDRNGLRPSRYILTNDNRMVMSSEVGVLDIRDNNIKEKGRLRPGKILMLDTEEGNIRYDPEIKQELASRKPYAQWLSQNRITLDDIKGKKKQPVSLGQDYEKYLLTFGYSQDEIRSIIRPMARSGKEPVGSMGNDTPLAVSSEKPQRLFNYFRQHFAQVTNPAIDPLKEDLVMTVTGYIGSHQKNLLAAYPDHARMIKFKNPVINNDDLAVLKNLKYKGFAAREIPALYNPKQGAEGLKAGLDLICAEAEAVADAEEDYLILSDRHISRDQAPIPSLLAVAAVHHHLLRRQKRMQVDIVVETAEAREVMHFALLFGYGASLVNPYGAFAVVEQLVKNRQLQMEYGTAEQHYIDAVHKGIFKVMSKMGTSTLRSYRAAQLFDAVGLNQELIDSYFTGTTSAIQGIGLPELAREYAEAHQKAFGTRPASFTKAFQGRSHYRYDAEKHAWNPESIAYLQHAVRTNSQDYYNKFTETADAFTRLPGFLRGFMEFKEAAKPAGEVEPAANIVKRFATGAMSFGSLSKEAHETLAIAMNRMGGKSNTGEGGEEPERLMQGANGNSKRSAIKQIASGRFGVNAHYLVNADEIQIKIAQGAKPGEGGQLPGHKVDAVIAKTRKSTPGITLISPPPHHDIYSIEDLAQLIFDLKNINPDARISVKLVSEYGVGTVAAGVAKGGADLIVISGAEGGTGASPVSSIQYAGLPVELGLAEVQQTLVKNNLRGKVTLQADGQLKTARDVVTMALLGAEEFGFATGALVGLGCILLRKCNLNTCSVGVATQDLELRKRFDGKPEHVLNYFHFLAEDIRKHLKTLGASSLDEIVGKSYLLQQRQDITHWKLQQIDLSDMLQFPPQAGDVSLRKSMAQEHLPEDILDKTLIKEAEEALIHQKNITLEHKIRNTDRAVGAMLSWKIDKLHGEAGLPDDTITCRFNGSAGQSFGAFLHHGTTFDLTGQSNDYLGKGLSGGKIIVKTAKDAAFKAADNIIIGNTTLYGATAGHAYINGRTGERFCVRNSGAIAVAEGAGDHCCEYMTGGIAVILGTVGRNMAAGMSGGVAYVYNPEGDLDYFCNMEMVNLEIMEDFEDILQLKQLLQQHVHYTGSSKAQMILDEWEQSLKKFIKVIPVEYKRYLEEKKIRELNAKIEQYASEQE